MKSDLQIIIEHLEGELTYLKNKITKASKEWNFELALNLREAYTRTKRKFDLLKTVENSNYPKIQQNKRILEMWEKQLEYNFFENMNLKEETINHLLEKRKNRLTPYINKIKRKLKELQSKTAKAQIDGEIILELLEEMERDEIHEIYFEITNYELDLLLRSNGNNASLKIIRKDNSHIKSSLQKKGISTLTKLGFAENNYSKTYFNFKDINKVVILTDLAVLSYEIFNLTGSQEILIKPK